MSDRSHQEVHNTVLSLVDAGNDNRFQEWLRLNRLLIKSWHCKDCSSVMDFTSDSKVLDKHKWVCQNSMCNNNATGVSIRHASFFENLPKALSLFDAFKVILLWCEGRSLSSIDFDTGRQRKITKQVFQLCDKVAETQLKEWQGKTKIGGKIEDNCLVLMDTYPCGYMLGETDNPPGTISHSTQGHNQFLCFADMDFMPPMMWVHLLRQGNKISQIVRDTVHPGSIIVTNLRTIPAVRLRQETSFRAVDVETLRSLDVPYRSDICKNLETIWQRLLPVLCEAENLPMHNTRLLLSRFLWYQRYGNNAASALYNLLVQIAQQFPLPR